MAPLIRKQKSDFGPRIDVDMDQQQQIVISHTVEVEAPDNSLPADEEIRVMAKSQFIRYLNYTQKVSNEDLADLWEQWFGQLQLDIGTVTGGSGRKIDGQADNGKELKVTQSLADKMWQHRGQFLQGVDQHHLPKGFKWLPAQGKQRTLHYSEGLAKKARHVDPLAAELIEANGPMDVFYRPPEAPKEEVKGFLGRMFSSKPKPQAKEDVDEVLHNLLNDKPDIPENIKAQMSRLPKAQKNWWVILLKQHLTHTPYDNVPPLFATFRHFTKTLEDLNLAFPDECKIKNIQSLPVTLGRITILIENARAMDRQAQLNVVHDLDLSSTGAVFALQLAQDKGEKFNFVHPGARFQKAHWYCERGTKTEYINGNHKDLIDDKNNEGYLSGREVRANKLKESMPELYEMFWREVAKAKDQLSMGFYEKALKKIEDSGLEPRLKDMCLYLVMGSSIGSAGRACQKYDEIELFACVDRFIAALTVNATQTRLCIAKNGLILGERHEPARAPDLTKLYRQKDEVLEKEVPSMPMMASLMEFAREGIEKFSGVSMAVRGLGSWMGVADEDAVERYFHEIFKGAEKVKDYYNGHAEAVERGVRFYLGQSNILVKAKKRTIVDFNESLMAIETAILKKHGKEALDEEIKHEDFDCHTNRNAKHVNRLFPKLSKLQEMMVANISLFDIRKNEVPAVFEKLDSITKEDLKHLNDILAEMNDSQGLSAANLIALAQGVNAMQDKSAEQMVKLVFAKHAKNFNNLSAEEVLRRLTATGLPKAMLLAAKHAIAACTHNPDQQRLLLAAINALDAKTIIRTVGLEPIIHKLYRVKEDLILSDRHTLQFLSLLSEFKHHSEDTLNALLDAILKTRNLSLFQFMAISLKDHPLKQENRLDKVVAFYAVKELMDNYNGFLPQQLLWPVLANVCKTYVVNSGNAKSSKTEAPLAIFLTGLYEMVGHFNKDNTQLKTIILDFVQALTLMQAGTENDFDGSGLERNIHVLSAFVKAHLHDPLTIESLFFHYKAEPGVLMELLAGVETIDINNVQFTPKQTSLVKAAAKLAGAKQGRPTAEQLKAVYANAHVDAALIDEFYATPPYPALDLLKNANAVTAVAEFKKSPYQRAAYNRFDIQKAKDVVQAAAASDTFNEIPWRLERLLSGVRKFDSESLSAFSKCNDDYKLAYVLEMLYRTTGQELNTTQVMAVRFGLEEKDTHMAEQIASGEGKSRIMMVMAAMHQLMGQTVDFVTSNMQLALRDYLEYDAFFKALGIETKLIHATTPADQYKAGAIHFSSAAQLSLFRNKLRSTHPSHPALHIPPEKRSCLLDEGDATFYDSSERYNFSKQVDSDDARWVYPLLIEYIHADREIFKKDDVSEGAYSNDFRMFLLQKSPEHQDELERISNSLIEHWIDAALVAKSLKKDEHFVIQKNAILFTAEGMMLADQALVRHNGRIAASSSYSHGVHQCLHALLNHQRHKALSPGEVDMALDFHVESERQIIYSSNAEQLLHEYDQGRAFTVTGTLGSQLEREEATEKYNFKMLDIPRHNTLKRKDKPVELLKDQGQQFDALLAQIKANTDRPVLIVCENDGKSEALTVFLKQHHDNEKLQRIHSLNTADEEAAMIECGKDDGWVTVSTDMVGRGTDFPVPRDHKKGLLTLVGYLPTVRNLSQIMNRSGRFGAQGETRVVLNKAALKQQAGAKSLKTGDINFYDEPERYLQALQTHMEKRKQTERLIAEYEGRIKKFTTDKFFNEHPGRSEADMKKWSQFQYEMDILWLKHQEELMSKLDTLNPDNALIKTTFDAYKAEVNALWHRTFEQTSVAINDLADLKISQGVKLPESKPMVHERWDGALAGRSKTFCHLFEESRALLLGDRKILANTRAWWNGHGVLFADTRATLFGHRKIFANTRASFDAPKPKT